MKILAIRGKNLASLGGEFYIDFNKEPLNNAGIFAITGSTGAGKSTLLDALCLALYDCTPRMNKAKEANVALMDVKDKSIAQNDSRSILRRGTADGYAEVDFVSITGDTYRSTWMVRRAGNKPSGSLQKVEMRLLNLNDGTEVQGTKTEIQGQIIRLVGLSFDQFSRSVLLAQGDFATFLKARQAEKAEILEKLTGTEIYSKISSSIFSKTKEVEVEKKELLRNINEAGLLSEEEMSKLQEEKNECSSKLVVVSAEEEKNLDFYKWIEEREVLVNSMKEAQENVNILKLNIQDATPRFEYMSLVESAQPIRDDFMEMLSMSRQLQDYKATMLSGIKALEHNVSRLKSVNDELEIAGKEQNANNLFVKSVEPQIELARKKDIQITELTKQCSVAVDELKRQEKNLKKSVADKELYSKEIVNLGSSITKIDKWFEHYNTYSNIVPSISLITNLLSVYYTSKQQIDSVSKSLEVVKANLAADEKNLSILQDELERLNKILPSEVLVIREELHDGEPCPVCGSCTHPYKEIHQNINLKEEELNRSKQKVGDEIERINKNIEREKEEITRSRTLIDNYEQQRIESFAKIEQYVSILPSWKDLLDKQELTGALVKFAEKWEENKKEQTELKEKSAACEASLKGCMHEIEMLSIGLDEKKVQYKKIEAEVQNLVAERKNLLDGRATNEFLNEIESKKSLLDKRVADKTAERHNCEILVEKEKSRISQIDNEIKRVESEITYKHDNIKKWLDSRQDITSEEKLKEILTKDNNWVANEKRVLTDMKEKFATANTILQERNNKIARHEESLRKPKEEVDKGELIEKLKQIRSDKESINKTLAQINVCFENNEKNQKKVAAYQKEYDRKSPMFESWTQLNDLFGSQTGSKFKEIAQGYTLDILLLYANKHLEELAPRYELQRVSDTLALQIIDLDMMGEKRSVHSLSGGESFLVSLALALGLSSLSSNRMNVESLFIDEGFGSLDIDTLRIAMDALERLQMQGRKIGVISHVAEMTERIAVRINVVKSGSGESRLEVEG